MNNNIENDVSKLIENDKTTKSDTSDDLINTIESIKDNFSQMFQNELERIKNNQKEQLLGYKESLRRELKKDGEKIDNKLEQINKDLENEYFKKPSGWIVIILLTIINAIVIGLLCYIFHTRFEDFNLRLEQIDTHYQNRIYDMKDYIFDYKNNKNNCNNSNKIKQ